MKDGQKRVIISTIFEGFAVKHAITKLSPDKLILLVDEPSKKDSKEIIEKSIKSLMDFFQGTLEIETIKISSYNIPKIMKEALKIIDKESKNNKIYIHITEGRKTISLALLYAAYRRKDKIENAYYITEEEHNIIKLPLLSFEINETKKEVLKEIEQGNFDIKKLQDKLKLGQSAAYTNINELKKEGYIENEGELKITDLGRMMII